MINTVKRLFAMTRGKVSLKAFGIIYILLYLIIMLMFCGISGTVATGEWDDYTYPAIGIIKEGRIGLKESDIPVLKDYYPEWHDRIDYYGIGNLSGKFTRSGETLPFYFPTYSITCIPLIIMFRFFGLSATYAFSFTNLLSVVGAITAVYFFLKVGEKLRLLLVILLSINPVVFYYCYASGECLIYAFLTLGLMCWFNGWDKRAAVFISLAGTLNVVIMSIGILMIVDYLVRFLRKRPVKVKWISYIKVNIVEILKYGSCYIIGIIPMIYFFYHTGYINLTASYSFFVEGNESILERFLSYLFDLNYGIFPYFPFLLLIGAFLCIMAIVQRIWKYFEWIAFFLVLVALYSVMVHINCGMAGIARYNVWGILPLIFAVTIFFREFMGTVFKTITFLLLLINVAILAIIIRCYGIIGAEHTSYTTWTPIARFVLDNCPTIYNPLHSTFNSRTNNLDGGYNYETPIIYSDDDGYIRKILATSRDVDELRTELSTLEEKWFNKELADLDNEESYISIPKQYKIFKCAYCVLGDPIVFKADGYNAAPFVLKGLHNVEDWGSWTDGTEFLMCMKTISSAKKLHISINGQVFNDTEDIAIFINDEESYKGRASGQDIEFDFDNPGANKPIFIKIEVPSASSPFSLGQSDDRRVLGIGIREIVITEC